MLCPPNEEENRAPMIIKKSCPNCGIQTICYRNPVPTVDIIIETDDGSILLIQRRNEPAGWALPGGFVDYGESIEDAAIREAKEETNMDITVLRQFHTYSKPDRDSRQHTISTVFVATGAGTPKAGDDARKIALFTKKNLPQPLVFDHGQILSDYFQFKQIETLTNCSKHPYIIF